MKYLTNARTWAGLVYDNGETRRTVFPEKCSYHVQHMAVGCIIFWERSCTADVVPYITGTLVLVAPTSEG